LHLQKEMREGLIEKKVTENAKKLGWLSFKWVSTSQRGVPDRLYFKDGKCVVVEFKATGKKATPYQQAVHRKLESVGIKVHIVDSVEGGAEILC